MLIESFEKAQHYVEYDGKQIPLKRHVDVCFTNKHSSDLGLFNDYGANHMNLKIFISPSKCDKIANLSAASSYFSHLYVNHDQVQVCAPCATVIRRKGFRHNSLCQSGVSFRDSVDVFKEAVVKIQGVSRKGFH